MSTDNMNAADINKKEPGKKPAKKFSLMMGRHRGRLAQIPIYLGKDFRMFIFQTDWKVLCSLALTCICIWNGFFNSIQSVCRERPIIKREHRSGMHISSYIIAHLIYQMFLCVMQAMLTVLVFNLVGVKFPEAGFITQWFRVDIWITLFLITYAADITSSPVLSATPRRL